MEEEVKPIPKLAQTQTHNNALLIKFFKLLVFFLLCLGIWLGKTYGKVVKVEKKKKLIARR